VIHTGIGCIRQTPCQINGRGRTWSEGRQSRRTNDRNGNLCPKCKGREELALIRANMGTAQCYIPEASKFYTCLCGSLKSHLITEFLCFPIRETGLNIMSFERDLPILVLLISVLVFVCTSQVELTLMPFIVGTFQISYCGLWKVFLTFINSSACSDVHCASCLRHTLLWTDVNITEMTTPALCFHLAISLSTTWILVA
jgi:hypothetical protein